jgi:hypothetical protein
MVKLKIPMRLRVKEWVEERYIEVLAEGAGGEKTDTTYETVMHGLVEGVGGPMTMDKRSKETRRVQILLIAGRNRGFCEFGGCKNSIWSYTQMHWHHLTHTYTPFKRWISWYKWSPGQLNLHEYETEIEKCELLCEHHHKYIHKIEAESKINQENRRVQKAELVERDRLAVEGKDAQQINKYIREMHRIGVGVCVCVCVCVCVLLHMWQAKNKKNRQKTNKSIIYAFLTCMCACARARARVCGVCVCA